MYARVAKQLRERAAQRARRARTQILLIVPLIAGVVFAYSHRRELFGLDVPVRVACVVALLILSVTVALRLAGLRPQTLAVGGAITAVILGLAAQQTIGNLIAGTVLMSARPFRVGDLVRLHAGGVAGQVEGTVTSLGLLYVTLANGEDRILVPNNVVLSGAVVPLREPSGVDVRARLPSDVKPSAVEERLEEKVSVATRSDPQIDLEEFQDGDVVVRIRATPVNHDDGAALADQVVEALDEVHRAEQVG